MDIKSEILHTRLNFESADPNVTPIFQNSSFLSSSPYFYSRKANPNCTELELIFSRLEDCSHSITTNTGMSAINLVLHLLSPGDHVIINRLMYGCTYRFFLDYCAQFDISIDVEDLCDTEWTKKISGKTKMVFFETPTNPLLKTIDINKVSQAVKTINPNAIVVVDNTWATPYFQKPLKIGADICVVSATKFYSGHSDCMAGVISTNNKELADTFLKSRFYMGANLDPNSAWLIRRSMQTFALRMENHAQKIKALSTFLSTRSEVVKVYIPEINDKQLTSYGCILFIELKNIYEEKIEKFMNSLKLFDRGTSMASVVSSVAQPYTGSHLSMTPKEKETAGINKTLVRLCFGLEDENDLKTDLTQALEGLCD